ncbi:conjugal transfer protein TraL [Vibrio hepatarius]|uniref:conjugal transfer protein TraL n=1 Tax=Vibrio hepatarius TaxID=171383 RepID=UPI00142E5C47|nr:conjugal transfer protein TraL [Vibrio hepatarius]NIY83721.1 conjugal transfer protein TraL [Vibrio hepatarius]
MTHKRLVIAITVVYLLPVHPAHATNDDECAIWLRLPTGFPSGCGDAKNAFKKRIKRLKPPLPRFSSYLFSGKIPNGFSSNELDMTTRSGHAAYVPPRSECVRWETSKDEHRCVKTEIKPSQIIKDQRCHIYQKQSTSRPSDCARTISYVETFQNGRKYGENYYFDRFGNPYTEGSTKH